MATMKEVADRADVSVATVSRVINKSGYVSPDLEARVHEAMRTLKYQPSALARSLRRQETQTIGVLVPQLDQPFFSALAFTVEKALFSGGYRTLICSAEEDQDKENAYVEMLLRQRVDGVIMVPTGRSVHAIRQFLDKNIPVVLVDRDLPALQANKVLSDNYKGGYEGMRYLLEIGHTKIGVIGAPAYSEAMTQRMAGIRQALADHHVQDNPELLVTGVLQQFEMGYQSALELLRQTPRPTAIFALTDVIAVGVMHAASALGLRLPQDLSVMGFDNIPLATYSIPGLTTIAQPIYEMGEAATKLLLAHVHTHELEPQTLVFDCKLVVRQSTAAL